MNKYVKLVLIGIMLIFGFIIIQKIYSDLLDKYKTDQELVTDDAEKEDAQETQDTEAEKQIDFTVIDMDEKSVKLSSFTGKPIILNFWASWCSPCRDELPDFQDAYDKYGADIEFVMVNLTDGSRETLESARNFVTSKGYTFPVYFDVNQEAAVAYSVYSIPTTYFIDTSGQIIASAQGMIDLETIEKGISLFESDK